MIEALPVFTVPPDWATPVRESLEWKTNIMASQIGAEQRVATRLNPRRRMEVPFTSIRREHAYLEQLLSIEPQGRYYVPVWFERGLVNADVTLGSTTANIDSLGREFLGTQFVIFLGKQPHQYEIAEVSSAVATSDTAFTFVDPLVYDWPAGTLVCPCRSAIIEANSTVSFTRAGARALQGSVRFLFDVPYTWVSALTPPTYLGQPVLELISNENDQQGGTFERLLGVYDSQTGPISQLDLGGKAFPTFASSNWIQGRPANEALRDLLYYVRGRQVHGWWVHPVDDFILAADITTGDTSITVERAGVADFGLSSSRTHIRILLRDGTTYYRELTGASNINDDTESLHLSAAVPADVGMADVESIRYMSQGRLAQDLVSIDHITDQEGITQYTLGIRMVPEIRVAADWDPPPLPLSAFVISPTQDRVFFRISRGLVTSGWLGAAGIGLPNVDPSRNLGGFDVRTYITSGYPPDTPMFLGIGVNTGGSSMGGVGIRPNFSGGFVGPVPSGAAPWAGAAPWGGSWSPTDGDPSQQIGASDTIWADAGVVRTFRRSSIGNNAAPGFRYMENYVDAIDISVSIGFMVGAAPLSLPTGDVTTANYIINPLGTNPGFFMINFLGPGSGFPSPVLPGDRIDIAMITAKLEPCLSIDNTPYLGPPPP